MARSYYGGKISKNLIETPEGYLICKDVPLARTGWMKYKGSELPPEFEEPSNGVFEVYRSPEQVFSPETIASFEGKPVTNTHPMENLTIDSVDMSEKGHAQDIRKDGEYLVGDLHIRDSILKSDILNDIKREISCGYDCAWFPLGNHKYEQRGIIGNHVAVVLNGRAGHRVKINDAIPDDLMKNINNKGGKNQLSNKFTKLFTSIGFKQWVQDKDPEEVAEAMQSMHDEEMEKEKLFSKNPGNDEKPDDVKEANDEKNQVADKVKDGDTVKEQEKKEEVKDATPDAMAQCLEKLNEVLSRIEKLETKEEKQASADEAFAGLEGEMAKKVVKDKKSNDDENEIMATGESEVNDNKNDDVENTAGKGNMEVCDEDKEKSDEYSHAVADSALKKFVTDMKPEIMKIKDKKVRDSLARVFVNSVRDAREVGDGSGYSEIMQTVNRNKSTAMDAANQHRGESMATRTQKSIDLWQERGKAMQKKGGNQ